MSRTDEEYLSWIVEHAGGRSDREHPRWVHVGGLLGLGSTSAWKICERFGFDPDEKMGVFLKCEEGCHCECHHE